MAGDEATIRVVLQGSDQRSAGGGGTSAPSPPAPSTQPPAPTSTQPSPPQPSAPTPTAPGGGFDPVAEANKWLEADKQRAAIEEEYAKLQPIRLPFDPVKEAQKRLDADKKRQAIDKEYAKLVPPEAKPAFDPYEEARKRREGERRAAQVDLAYQEQYGEDKGKSVMDAMLDLADTLRGTIGGLTGVVGGAILDIVSAFRQIGTGDEAEQRKRALAAEGEEAEEEGTKEKTPLRLPKVSTRTVTDAAAKGLPEALPPMAKAAPAEAGAEGAEEAVASFGSKLGAAVPIVGAFTAAVVVGAKVLLDLINGMEERYADYSPEMQQAQALAEVQREMNSLRRAQDMGPEMARFIEMKANVQEKFEEIKIKIMMKILPIVTTIGEVLELLMPAAEAIADAINKLTNPLGAIAGSSTEMKDMLREDRLPKPEDPTSMLFDDKIKVPAEEVVPGLVGRQP